MIGPKALDNFGAEEPDLVHVRNHNYRKDYEVLKVRNKYADLYLCCCMSDDARGLCGFVQLLRSG